MTKDKEKTKTHNGSQPKTYISFLHSSASELRIRYPFIIAVVFIICIIVTILNFLPFHLVISTADLRACLSSAASASPPPPISQLLENGTVRRTLHPVGSAAYSFVTMGAYRGGTKTFAVVGLSSKPLQVFGKPTYSCEWIPRHGSKRKPTTVVSKFAYKILPDWGFGRVYTVVVVNCTFSDPVNADNSGGKLVLYSAAAASDGASDKIECLSEEPGSFNASLFRQDPKYAFLYCGSPLFGNLSPQRVREWIAYHVRLFGEKSHFVIHDAGGVNGEVFQVLKPWMELGYVTLQDVRDEERFDGYYHNQFLVLNDCLHRHKFMAKWIFFFDIDEFIYVQPDVTINSVVNSFSGYTQFSIAQASMSNKLCISEDIRRIQR